MEFMKNRIDLLDKTQYKDSKIIEELVNEENGSLYKLEFNTTQNLFLKIIPNSIKAYEISLPILKSIVDTDNIIQKYSDIIHLDDYILLFTKEFTEDNSGKKIPLLYEKLASFHLSNRTDSLPVSSNYLDYNEFGTISEMVDFEFKNHIKNITVKDKISELKDMIEPLKNGFATIIHGNIHPGNVLSNNTPILIDTETIHISNNLYDFEFLDLFDLNNCSPWYIKHDAKSCYRRYFEVLNIVGVERYEIVKAIETLNLLRENSYKVFCGEEYTDGWLFERIDVIRNKKIEI